MKPVRPDPAAQAEIRAEVRWYECKRPGLGQQLLDEIELVALADIPIQYISDESGEPTDVIVPIDPRSASPGV